MNNKLITIILVFILGFSVYFLFYKSSKDVEEYSKRYDVSLIADEYKNQVYEEKFILWQDRLEGAIKSYELLGKKVEDKPNSDFFIEKARYANYLGMEDWAIETLNNLFDYYDNSSVAWNNLAKIYEHRGEYEKANENYFSLINTFGEESMWSYYSYVIRNYKSLDDRENVQKYYDIYRGYGGSSLEIEEYLNEN